MKRYLLSGLFVALLFFISNNISFADYNTYNQGSYCTEAQYNQLKAQYDSIVQRMQEANPYTQMSQVAPINLDEYARALNRQQQTNAMIRANNIAMGGQAQPVDFGNEALQLAQARQAAEVARQTGLTPEQFLQSQTMNYNTAANFYMQQMQQYQELMTQCLKNMRRQQYNNYQY